MNADGSGQRRLVPKLKHDNDSPAWSPDGLQIAFVVCHCRIGHVDLTVYVVNRDGTNLRRLASEGSGSTVPEWSPDGSKLLFQRSGDSRGSTVVVRSASGEVRHVVANTEFADWSPDGRSIAVAGQGGALRIVGAAGGRPRAIVQGVTGYMDW